MYTYMYTYYCVYLRMSSSRHFGSVAIIGGLPPIHDIVQVCVCVLVGGKRERGRIVCV